MTDTDDVLTIEKLQAVCCTYTKTKALPPNITVSCADYQTVYDLVRDEVAKCYSRGLVWTPNIAIWADRRLRAGEMHWGKPKEPVEAA